MTTELQITEHTDAACPWAWSAEPAKRRLQWLYGDALDWRVRMVGLAEDAASYVDRGFTPERMSDAFRKMAGEYGMPIDTAVRERMSATVPGCRAVVAVRRHAPEREHAFLRALRVLYFSGELLDAELTFRAAAQLAGVDGDSLVAWIAEPETEEALREDMRLSRLAAPEAVALKHKLAAVDGGGYRYTCPSLVFERVSDGAALFAPGFQPVASYEIAVANLAPDAARRDPPASMEELLRWAGEPLATAEVAAVCELSLTEAREQLGRVAVEQHIGSDGIWSLAA